MGLGEWASGRWDRRQWSAWIDDVCAQPVERYLDSLAEHDEWLRDQLRELGATDDVFRVLDQYAMVNAAIGLHTGRRSA